MRKFYKMADSGTAPGGHVVRLDGKTIRTPLQRPLIVPTAALAAAMAQEWARQGDTVNPAAMPLNQLANTMVDKTTGKDRTEIAQQLKNYGASDLVCYLADHPPDLLERQQRLWLPLLEWMEVEYGVKLETVTGIRYHTQPAESAGQIEKLLNGLDPATFTATQAAAGLAGSLVIGLALATGRITAEEAYQAACVDEIYQLEKWGADELAQKKLNSLRAECAVIEQFRKLVTEAPA